MGSSPLSGVGSVVGACERDQLDLIARQPDQRARVAKQTHGALQDHVEHGLNIHLQAVMTRRISAARSRLFCKVVVGVAGFEPAAPGPQAWHRLQLSSPAWLFPGGAWSTINPPALHGPRGAEKPVGPTEGVAMKRSCGMLVSVLPLTLIFGTVATVSAVILIVVVELLTLFAVVGLSFTFYADVRAVPTPSADVVACDIVISVLDERGDILDTRQARVASGEMVTLRYRSRAEPGSTEVIRATIRSRTVPRLPLPPGPCPILASMQVVDGTTGRTEAMMMPAAQEDVRVRIPAP